MLKNRLTVFVHRSHYWRSVAVNQLTDLYLTAMLRSLALSIVGIFIPIYFYVIGYSLTVIIAFFAFFFGVRILTDMLSAVIVAQIGPKHTMSLSAVLLIAFLCLAVTLQSVAWPLWVLAVLWAFSMSSYFVAYHVSFSKIKHSLHSGSEIGYMYIFERIAGIIGPLLGGLVATVFGARYILFIAIAILVISLAVLLFTPEPVRVHQKLSFSDFPWHQRRWDYLTLSAFGLENTVSVMLWPLLVAVTVFTSGTFAKLGLVVAASTALALVVTRVVSLLTDSSKVSSLIRFGVIVNSLVHAARPFVLTNAGVIAATFTNDSNTVVYKMPITKRYYDTADALPGHRIVYIATTEAAQSVSKFVVWLLIFVLANKYNPIFAMKWIYLFVAVYSLGMLKARSSRRLLT